MPDFPALVSSYNTKLRIFIALNYIGGVIAFTLAYLFFKYVAFQRQNAVQIHSAHALPHGFG